MNDNNVSSISSGNFKTTKWSQFKGFIEVYDHNVETHMTSIDHMSTWDALVFRKKVHTAFSGDINLRHDAKVYRKLKELMERGGLESVHGFMGNLMNKYHAMIVSDNAMPFIQTLYPNGDSPMIFVTREEFLLAVDLRLL